MDRQRYLITGHCCLFLIRLNTSLVSLALPSSTCPCRSRVFTMSNLGALVRSDRAMAQGRGTSRTGLLRCPVRAGATATVSSKKSLTPVSHESPPLGTHRTVNGAHYNSCSVLSEVKAYCGASLESFHLLLATHGAGRKPTQGQRPSRLHTSYFSP